MTKNDPEISLTSLIEENYVPQIQMSPYQALLIGQCIWSFRPHANVLIFGCGYDTKLWRALNPIGKTVFLEDNPSWLKNARTIYPGADIRQVSYSGWTVQNSVPYSLDRLEQSPPPPDLASISWDVIIVDAPSGFKDEMPGRALAIYWASALASPTTHVFVDDYDRPLEKLYADTLLRKERPWSLEIPRQRKFGYRTHEIMLWSVGFPMESPKRPAPANQ